MARPFHEIFAGLDDAYGTYVLPANYSPKPGEKFAGEAKTFKDTHVTAELYYDHLQGKGAGLGIVPIRRDNFCTWFVIDVDDYNPDKDLPLEYAAKIEKLDLPLVVTRSKSNGPHLHCFLTSPLAASQCRKLGIKFIKKLGLSEKTEIFPKQDKLSKGGQGNWINLPYFGNSRPAVYQGRNLDLDQFIQRVAARQVSAAEAQEWLEEKAQIKFPGPPCIEIMEDSGVVEGGRNNALFHVGTYLMKRYPEDWSERLLEWNDEHCEPPEDLATVQRTIGSLSKKGYQFLCKVDPMCRICDKSECARREFGIGNFNNILHPDFPLKELVLIDGDVPSWDVLVNEIWIHMTSDQLFNFRRFRMRVAETALLPVPTVTNKDWDEAITLMIENAKRKSIPAVSQERGQVIETFNDWCLNGCRGSPDGQSVLDGRPFYDQDRKVLIFKGMALQKRVSMTLPSRIAPDRVWAAMANVGAYQATFEWEGREIAVWELEIEDPWFELPDVQGERF